MAVNNGSHIRLLVTQFTKSLTFNKNFQCSCQICFKPLRGWGYVHRGLVPHSVSTNTTSYYNNATRAFLNISGTVVLFYPVRLVFEAAFFCLLRRSQWYWKRKAETFDASTSLYPLLETRTSRRPKWWSTGKKKRTTWTKYVLVWEVIVSTTENEESTQTKKMAKLRVELAANLSTKSSVVLRTGTASARWNVSERQRHSVIYSTV